MTAVIAEAMYEHLEEILPQKGCKRGSRGTKDQLLIDKEILQDCKRRRTNLTMAWIDYHKAYDMVPHSWIMECLEMFGVSANVRQFLASSMDEWKTELTSCGQTLGVVDINRGIFHGDSLAPLLFVLCMVPLSSVLRRSKVGYEWGGRECKINHLLFMDDLKLFGKSYEQINALAQTVHIFSSDIGMEFGIKKCGVLVLKRGKIAKIEGMVLPDGQVMKEIDDNGYKYLEILEADHLKEKEMKALVSKEYKRRLKLVLKTKLSGRNKIMAVNTCPKSDVDRLYLSRQKGGRGLISCAICVKDEENNLASYLKNSNERVLAGVRGVGILNSDKAKEKRDFKQERQNASLNRWKEKKMHGQFLRDMPETVDKDKMWEWTRKSDLKIGTEALIFAAQEQALRTNYVKFNI